MDLSNLEMQFALPSTVDRKIFRAYDIRGVVGSGITPEVVYALGRALGTRIRQTEQCEIVMGYDGRCSAPQLAPALAWGLMDSGIAVTDIGQVPTSVLYFATHHLHINSGVMLTASHNPADYNGLKMVLNGRSLTSEDIAALYDEVMAQAFIDGEGTYTEVDVQADYVQRIANDVRLQRPLKIVLDAGNGVAGPLALTLYRELGCEVIPLHCEVDGTFPNHEPDPSQLENLADLIAAVHQHKADIGLALDGDGDRLGLVTNEGEVIWPDRQMMVYAIDVLKRNPGAPILFDVKCTRHLAEVIRQYGGQPMMWKTGHSLIKSRMQETGALLGGEMSGHIFYGERWYGFDDGLYAGSRFLEILASKVQSAASLFADLPNSVYTPELKLSMAEEIKFSFMEQFIALALFESGEINTLDGLRVDFPHGWGLIRPSNTSPYLIFRFEADTADNLTRIQNLFRDRLLAIDGDLLLPF